MKHSDILQALRAAIYVHYTERNLNIDPVVIYYMRKTHGGGERESGGGALFVGYRLVVRHVRICDRHARHSCRDQIRKLA